MVCDGKVLALTKAECSLDAGEEPDYDHYRSTYGELVGVWWLAMSEETLKAWDRMPMRFTPPPTEPLGYREALVAAAVAEGAR